jgi:hypothetical protein
MIRGGNSILMCQRYLKLELVTICDQLVRNDLNGVKSGTLTEQKAKPRSAIGFKIPKGRKKTS